MCLVEYNQSFYILYVDHWYLKIKIAEMEQATLKKSNLIESNFTLIKIKLSA